MKTVTLYEYDSILRPGELGADFEDGNPNHFYTLRYEGVESTLLGDVRDWLNIGTSGNLRDKLKNLMPKKSEPEAGDMMLQFDSQPIRRAADYFAYAIDYDLPTDRDELLALLWVFGECLNGEMERREKATTKMIDDLLYIETKIATMERILRESR